MRRSHCSFVDSLVCPAPPVPSEHSSLEDVKRWLAWLAEDAWGTAAVPHVVTLASKGKYLLARTERQWKGLSTEYGVDIYNALHAAPVLKGIVAGTGWQSVRLTTACAHRSLGGGCCVRPTLLPAHECF